MILIDYSQIALSNIIVQKLNDESMIRHMILNSIRMYNKRYRDEYGQLVICADGMNTWRKQFFPEYKGQRKKGRESSGMDWTEIFRILHTVRDETVFQWCLQDSRASLAMKSLQKTWSAAPKTSKSGGRTVARSPCHQQSVDLERNCNGS